MFKMYIKLDNSRLIADGFGSKAEELTDIIKDIDSYTIESFSVDTDGNTEHSLSTTENGDESFLITILEETPWFMKYVKEWNTDDNGFHSNMIEVERKLGERCSYA